MAEKRKPRKRANSAGSVYCRKSDKRWVGSLTKGYDENGKPIRVHVYGQTRAEAEDKLLAAMYSHRTGLLLDPAKENVKQFLGRWLRDSVQNSVRPLTYQSYEINVRRHIVPVLGQVLLRQLTPAHIQALYVQKLREGLSPRSVQYMSAILSRALRQAVRWELIPRNPADAADKPRVQRKPMPGLSADEAKRLLEAAREDRLEALFVLTVTTGMRIGEVLGLAWDHVDLHGERLEVVNQLQRLPKQPPQLVPPKTAQSRRVIVLSPMAVAALRRHRTRQVEDRLAAGSLWANDWNLVFTDERGAPLSRERVSQGTFKRLLRNAGLPNIPFHGLRHTAATMLLAAGGNVKAISELLGHSTVSFTLATYTHATFEMQKNEAMRMQDILGGKNQESAPTVPVVPGVPGTEKG